jgi:hypothetical protein
VVEYLPRKCEALSSNSNSAKKKQKQKQKENKTQTLEHEDSQSFQAGEHIHVPRGVTT